MASSVSWEHFGTCTNYSGVVTFDDFMGAVLEIHSSPNYSRFRYSIHDMSSAQRIDFSGVDMTYIVSQELGARFTNPKVKASVVASDPDMIDMIRTFTEP